MKTVWVTSLFGSNTHQGLVGLAIDDVDIQMQPAAAREIAQHLIEAAESSSIDQFLWEYLQGAGFEEQQVVQVLQDFRKWREHQATAKVEVGP